MRPWGSTSPAACIYCAPRWSSSTRRPMDCRLTAGPFALLRRQLHVNVAFHGLAEHFVWQHRGGAVNLQKHVDGLQRSNQPWGSDAPPDLAAHDYQKQPEIEERNARKAPFPEHSARISPFFLRRFLYLLRANGFQLSPPVVFRDRRFPFHLLPRMSEGVPALCRARTTGTFIRRHDSQSDTT